jgi:hypothetical protein
MLALRLQMTPKAVPNTYYNFLYITQIAQSRFSNAFAALINVDDIQ